jgi:hypothetical protein
VSAEASSPEAPSPNGDGAGGADDTVVSGADAAIAEPAS